MSAAAPPPIRSVREQTLHDLDQMYREVDQRVARLAARHAPRLQCRRGCAACCVDGIVVLEVEAERIRAHHADLLRRELPYAHGQCAFLDAESSCRIYADRPYACRVQGLPLRWFEEVDPVAVLERPSICPLNAGGEPVETLDPGDCWRIGPFEERLADLQMRLHRGERRETPLRDLFHLRAPTPASSFSV